MKKVSIISLILLVIFVLAASSCGSGEERVFVEEFGYKDMDMACAVADVNNLEAVTELSSHIVKCEIVSCEDVLYNDIGLLNFLYSVEITDIYLDTKSSLKEGDIISVMTNHGILKASEAAAIVKDDPRAKKLGILQGEYQDNEYIRSSTWDAVPIEVGKTYIMFLTDEYLENEGVYADTGRKYLFEIDGRKVRSGREAAVDERTAKELLNEIKAQIKVRTGRVDEVGWSQYVDELGERQRQEALKDQSK